MTVCDDMRAILQADAELVAILTGGIYSEPLNPNDPVTGAAWQATAPSTVRRLRPSAVMLEPQEVDAPLERNPGRRLDSEQWPELVLYAERGDVAEVFATADERAMELLHDRLIGLHEIEATGYRARPLEADELPGDVWSTLRRYRVRMVRHIAEV